MPIKSKDGKRQYYEESHLKDETFYQLPKWLMNDPEFSSLSNDAKILYTYLKDRFRLSTKNRWIDKQGRVFVIWKRESMQEMLNKSENTIKKIIDELKKVNLIDEVRNGKNKPNFLYLLMPALTVSENTEKTFEEDNWHYEEYDEDYCEEGTRKNCGSGSAESEVPKDPQNLRPNNNKSYKDVVNNLSIIELERKNEIIHFEEYIKKNTPFKCLNFIDFYEIMSQRLNVQNCKYALDHLTSNDFVKEKIIKQFLSLLADILSCEDEYYYASKNKRYKTVSFKQRILLLDENLFAGIFLDLEDISSIHSIKPYLTELLFNAPINSSSDALKKKDYSKYLIEA